ncbi:MAG: putative Fe-S cluster assembly protein SufT [Verrucomicrobiae bacterium]|nr:putative Fe-S cluster assembly protein SufT [Verrucomicrobiae bacterium]
MEPSETVTLTRDVEAITVPSGTKMTLTQGNPAVITQSLGGTYTVVVNGNMFRIDNKDADALGKQPAVSKPQAVPGSETPQTTGPVNEQEIWNMMRMCFDPEIPVNIVDLGLVYSMKVSPLPTGSNRVDVAMTLTAPGCGMGGVIAEDVKNKILTVDGVTEADVQITFDPPWNQSMLTEAAKLQLGLM